MRLSVLGPPELVRADGSPAGLAPGKTLAVLVYLAHATSPPSRADLARLFWPGSEPSKARHSVRQTLSLIRKVIGEDAFVSDDPLKLRPGALETDTEEFLAALAGGEIETADRLWRGNFAEGLLLANAPEWNRWVEERQLALEHRLCEGLTTEAEAARFRTDEGAETVTADATRLLRRAITVDPYRERPRVVLAELMVRQGKLDEAANEIAEARRALGEDTPDLQQLERLIEAEVSRRYAAGDADAAPALGELFVGRTAELGRLIGAWARAEQGMVVTAVVEGPAGIGKTRLTRELAAHVRGRGGIVAFTSPLPAEANIPGGVLRDLETQLIAGIAGTEPGRNPASSAGNGSEVAAAERIVDLLRRAPEPVLLVVDDLQWADPVTRSVLARVLRQVEDGGSDGRAGRTGCLFTYTVRTEAADREVQETVRALRDKRGSVRLELGPLSDDEARELLALAAHLEEFESDGSLARIMALAGGSPLYLIELLRTLAETGVLATDASGQLRLAAPLPDPLPFPKGMRELLETRLRALPDEAATVAAHLAGARGRAGVDALREATGLATPEFSRGLGTLLDREILAWVGPTELAFVHEEVRRTLAHLYPLAADLELQGALRRERRFGWAAVALATIPIAVAVVWRLFANGAAPQNVPPSPPFGGGSIVLLTEDEIVELRPHAGPFDQWPATRSPLAATEADEYSGPFLTTAGERVLFGRVLEEGRSPRAVRVEPDGSLVDVARSDWDEGKPWLSPDGGHIAWERGRLQGTSYPHEVRVARADGSEPRVILEAEQTVGVRGWSPSGRFILVSMATRTDYSLLVITPRGERRAAWLFDGQIHVAWCGQSDRFAVLGIRNGEPGIWLGSPRESDLVPIPAGEALSYPIACSPDASGIVYARAVDGRMRLVLLDVASGAFEPLPPDLHARGGIAWLPETLAPVTVSLAIEPDSLVLDWGDTLAVHARVMRSDSSSGENPVTWRSSDPAVVSVRPDGTLTANGPGHAVAVAEVEGWLRDSVRVEVRATDRPGVLLQDDFSQLDPARWIAFGSPPARAIQRGDTTAVFLRGDGVYHDGILSRPPLSLRGGATLELEFRLPLRELRPQRLIACLADPGPDLSAWADVQFLPDIREAACLTYPTEDLERLVPDEVRVNAAGWSRALRLPGDLPSDDWVHVAIQVRGDGMPFFFLNRRLIGTGPLRLTGLDRESWHVLLAGKSDGTELLARRLVVWRGTRFVPLVWSLTPIDEASHNHSVWAASESSVWVTGGYRVLWHFDGTAWSPRTLPPGTQNTYRILGFPDSTLFIAGQAGVERYDGQSWTTILEGVGELFGAWGTGPEDLYVSGDGRFLHFDGREWTDIPTGLSTEFNRDRLLTVWGSASNDVWVGGMDGRILHWNGSQLTPVLHVPGENIHAIHGSGPDDVFAVGTNGRIWHFDGAAWRPMESGTNVGLNGLFALSPMEVYAVGERGTLLHYDGTNWGAEASGTGRELHSIFALSPSRVYVATQGAVLEGRR